VVLELMDRGLRVVPQVGTAGYRIDIGVLDDDVAGRFLCGIECDGVAYHSSETARDRDRLRQQVLESRGWVIHRVWSTDWFKDRRGQVDRLLGLIAETKGRRTRSQASKPAPQPLIEPREVGPWDDPPARLTERQASPTVAGTPYVRPTAPAYRMEASAGIFAGRELLEAPIELIAQAVVAVADAEAPLHEVDLFARVAGMWGQQRVGSRIHARIAEGTRRAVRDQRIERRGPFIWKPGMLCIVRSRAGTGIPADRIPPEEYELAVLTVLGDGHGLPRPLLLAEVRSLLGFRQTRAFLEETINAATDRLLAAG